MEQQIQDLQKQISELSGKIDRVLNASPSDLLTKKEYLEKRKISATKLWREEKRGQVVPVFIGSSKYYKIG